MSLEIVYSDNCVYLFELKARASRKVTVYNIFHYNFIHVIQMQIIVHKEECLNVLDQFSLANLQLVIRLMYFGNFYI